MVFASSLFHADPGGFSLCEDALQWPRIPYFFSLEPGQSLNTVLCQPHHLFLEIGEYRALDASLCDLLSSAPDFALSLTTATAYRASVAHTLVWHLQTRFGLSPDKTMAMSTCLQEALIKAIIGGNLAMESPPSQSGSLDAYYATIDMRLAQAPFKDRRVSVAVWNFDNCLTLAIGTQGKGFAPDGASPADQGLFLIQSLADRVWIDEDQRSLYMTFRYRPWEEGKP